MSLAYVVAVVFFFLTTSHIGSTESAEESPAPNRPHLIIDELESLALAKDWTCGIRISNPQAAAAAAPTREQLQQQVEERKMAWVNLDADEKMLKRYFEKVDDQK